MQFISFKRRNDYVDDGGPVRHLDDSGLRRPPGPSAPQRIVMGAFVAAAAILCAALLAALLLTRIHDAEPHKAKRASANADEGTPSETPAR